MKFEGFNRVVINYDGEATTERRAHEMGITPDVGFMRDDGWSLGAPADLEDVAFRLWADEWKYIIRKPQSEWSPIK